MALLAAAALAQGLDLAPRADFAVEVPGCTAGIDCSEAPFGLVSGDFDGDGLADVATANDASDDVTVLLGDGTGSLEAYGAVGVGERPSAIASGFIDADLDIDLVVANDFGNSVSVLLGVGDGRFVAGDNPAVGVAPQGVALADFDGDGALDIATANLYGNDVEDPDDDSVSVLLGNGNGTFEERTDMTLPGGPLGIAAGDLDGDGRPDLAVTLSAFGQVAILIGNGNGTFRAPELEDVGEIPVGVVIDDFDGDGKRDIAVVNEFADSVSVLLGEGGGALTAATEYVVGGFPEAIAAGDVDGDGALDLVTADSYGTVEFQEGTVSALLGDGEGGFADAQSFGTGLSPFGVALADLDGDGALDVVTANLDGSDVSVLINVSEPSPCSGDCNEDGQVTVAELVVGVNIALGSLDADQCPSFNAGGEGRVTIDDLLRGVNAALSGCRL